MKFREYFLFSGTKILLGKDSKNNDELVSSYTGKENIILHTANPGSPFCVIDKIEPMPSKKEIKSAAIICASKSQDWRDNKKNVNVHQFTGKEVYKNKTMKSGTWGIRKTPKIIKVKKRDIEEYIQNKNQDQD